MISYIETMVLVIIIIGIGSAELMLIYAVFKGIEKLYEKYKERKNEKIKTEHHQSKNEESWHQTH